MNLTNIRRVVWVAVALIASGCAMHSVTRSGNKTSVASFDDKTEVVAIAEKMVGAPYRYGGSSPAGFDCSGLVQYSYGKAGYRLPRDTTALFARTRKVNASELKPGDLLFFRIKGRVSHVGIYVEGDTFVHAPSSGKAVGYGSLTSNYWKTRFVKAGRI